MTSKRSFRKKAWILFSILAILFVFLQFIRPPLDNPPVTADLNAPPDVKAVLHRACYNCHSNETRLAWFDQPAPAYWLVAADVKKARKAMNFSNWDSLSKPQQAAKLFEAIFQAEQKAMPLPQYRLLHHEAVVSSEDIALLKSYVSTLAYKAVPDSARERAFTDQYARWSKTIITPADIHPQHNGIGYAALAGFGDWEAISTTERYDNGTLRIILGNDITVKAIREGHTNPWPDGAIFAKCAWDQLPDPSGNIHAGAFKQVEFMIRDKEKYASTFGWGWARWVGGLAMKPYGKDASFTTECMNCHRPLEKNNYTFTFPLADTLTLTGPSSGTQDPRAAHPLAGRVITSYVSKREGTMSTLYGNELAASNARSGQDYPAGAVLTLVTWSQREDPHWFGGRIPAAVQTVETILFDKSSGPLYKQYTGEPLVEASPEAGTVTERIAFLLSLKASILL
jgi:hypothetical protein